MAQFDVHVLPDDNWVVNVQSDFISDYRTTFVIPLVLPDEDAIAVRRLNPRLLVCGEERLLATQLATTVRSRLLGPPRATLGDHDFVIKAALDMLISGF